MMFLSCGIDINNKVTKRARTIGEGGEFSLCKKIRKDSDKLNCIRYV
jgi:hypothetical protein